MDCFPLRSISLALALLAATCTVAAAADEPAPADLVKASLIADADAAVPGGAFTLGLRLKIAPHWHTYWANPGDSGQATRIKLKGPEGFSFGAIQWPLPHRIEIDGTITFGYEEDVLLLIPVTVAKDAKPGDARIEADARWLSCKETCVEGEAKLAIDLPVRPEAKPAHAELFAAWRAKLPTAAEASTSDDAVARVEQGTDADGSPAKALTIRWKQPPRKVEWFPLANRAAAVQDIAVKHAGSATAVTFKTKIYRPDQIPGGRLDAVIVYEDAQGNRRGVTVPFAVLTETK